MPTRDRTDEQERTTKKKSKVSRSRTPPTGKTRAAAGPPSPSEVVAAAREAAYTEQSPQAAFEHFRPLAQAVPIDDLTPFNGQALLMRANILTALAAVEPHLEAAVAHLAAPRLQDVFELPALALALDYAVGRVPVAKLSAGEIEAMLVEGTPWRQLMLSYLEVASHPEIDLLPRERVAAVRAGKGKLDMAQDFVALPGLFTEFADRLAGKHPFPSTALARLAELGGALVQSIRPGRAATPKIARPPEAILRDQLAALVTARYDYLGVLATVAVGKRKSDDLIPALRSTRPRPSSDDAEPTEPAEPALA